MDTLDVLDAGAAAARRSREAGPRHHVARRWTLIRDRMLGRVLGRAIAHEAGHFLFASSAHPPDGLMRASHRLEHLLDPSPSLAPFRVASPAMPACLVVDAAR